MSRLTLPVSSRDHIKGSETAPVTLVEYGDYECPYCGAAHSVVKGLQRHFGNRLRFVFRNFPLTQIHPQAEPAAEAAEAAAQARKFWAMHDTIYEHQSELDDIHLVGYGDRVGVPAELITDALVNHTYADRISEDFSSGVRSGVNGTPSFFINGEKYQGPYDLASLTAALDEALSLADRPMAKR